MIILIIILIIFLLYIFQSKELVVYGGKSNNFNYENVKFTDIPYEDLPKHFKELYGKIDKSILDNIIVNPKPNELIESKLGNYSDNVKLKEMDYIINNKLFKESEYYKNKTNINGWNCCVIKKGTNIYRAYNKTSEILYNEPLWFSNKLVCYKMCNDSSFFLYSYKAVKDIHLIDITDIDNIKKIISLTNNIKLIEEIKNYTGYDKKLYEQIIYLQTNENCKTLYLYYNYNNNNNFNTYIHKKQIELSIIQLTIQHKYTITNIIKIIKDITINGIINPCVDFTVRTDKYYSTYVYEEIIINSKSIREKLNINNKDPVSYNNWYIYNLNLNIENRKRIRTYGLLHNNTKSAYFKIPRFYCKNIYNNLDYNKFYNILYYDLNKLDNLVTESNNLPNILSLISDVSPKILYLTNFKPEEKINKYIDNNYKYKIIHNYYKDYIFILCYNELYKYNIIDNTIYLDYNNKILAFVNLKPYKDNKLEYLESIISNNPNYIIGNFYFNLESKECEYLISKKYIPQLDKSESHPDDRFNHCFTNMDLVDTQLIKCNYGNNLPLNVEIN